MGGARAPHSPGPPRSGLVLPLSSTERQGESGGQHLSFSHSQHPLADLATGLRLSLRQGGGGLLPGAREEETRGSLCLLRS